MAVALIAVILAIALKDCRAGARDMGGCSSIGSGEELTMLIPVT